MLYRLPLTVGKPQSCGVRATTVRAVTRGSASTALAAALSGQRSSARTAGSGMGATVAPARRHDEDHARDAARIHFRGHGEVAEWLKAPAC
ncbi:hypothetical protein C7Y72_02515 [Paraconexibacter algicola]|uniref:Uncharacterized protein n=1 Tax=Paraconexibacter algicola TaxID=2133960 RepID=A0A2T4UHA9_9ACTN|nr:hypothetical protein C7Y72_02515 [Paraconexibacter algicola]